MKQEDFYNIFRRFLARLTDEFCFLFIFIYLLKVSDSSYYIKDFLFNLNPLLFIVLVAFLFIFVEALLICTTATTLGKFLFGIYITDENDKKLSLKQSLKRAWYVYFHGIGLGVLFVMPFSMISALLDYKKYGKTQWDIWLKTKIGIEKIGISKRILSFLCLFSLIFYFFSMDEIISYPKGQKSFKNQIISYKMKLVYFVKSPFFNGGKKVYNVEKMLNDANELLKHTYDLQRESEKIFDKGKFFAEVFKHRKLENINNVEEDLDRFFSFVLCSVEAKIDILSYLEINDKGYEINDNQIEFKDKFLQYFFDLRENRLNECASNL